MRKDKMLKEIQECENRKQKLREEIRAEKDILALSSKIEELDNLSNRIFELNSLYRIEMLNDLQAELKERLGL